VGAEWIGGGPKTFPVVCEEGAVKDLKCTALQQLNEAILFG